MYQELQKGWIEVICGPMFAGKSEELIRRVKTLSYAHQKIIAFKPAIDNRYDKSAIASHDGEKYQAFAIKSAEDILPLVESDVQVVAIDEVQFFKDSIVSICESLADRGVRVIVAGLDTDFRGEPFGVMPLLLARAEFVTKLSAACTVCGCAATRTQRLVDGKPANYDDPIILVGAKESYEARCRKHHIVPNKPNSDK
ncbi:MAG: thymidine kinase [Candidatus Enterosoma sp.]|nr:thymidine kinase [Bacilli bacterium]MDD7213422.1 thymidine kinase [bacterium]MDY2571572.1 thymidine kinase [Candidatus Enterosoma sp.]MCI6608447.1 thymidine kinase [Bacilli bacterium]MCI7064882.1 thymidine kinase [Bacilli bacterium]